MPLNRIFRQGRVGLFSLALMAALPMISGAASLYVAPPPVGSDDNAGTEGSPVATIATAVGKAADGDTIILNNGTYTGTGNHDVVLGAGALTIQGLSGAATTIIDCEGLGRAFDLSGGGSNSEFDGLTIRNGAATSAEGDATGGAILGGTFTVRNCVFESCSATAGPGGSGRGGAVYGGSLRLINSRFTNCTARGGPAAEGLNAGDATGGAVHGHTLPPLVRDCEFTGNTAKGGGVPAGVNGVTAGSGYGGGLFCGSAIHVSVMSGSSFSGNRAQGGDLEAGPGLPGNAFGGGLSISLGDLTDVSFTGNEASSGNGGLPYLGAATGGAISAQATTFHHCQFTGNTTTAPDTVPEASAAAARITRQGWFQDCSFESNSVPVGGVGTRPSGSVGVVVISTDQYGLESEFDRCTFAGNQNAGAAIVINAVDASAVNCTFSGNTDAFGPSAVATAGTRGINVINCTFVSNASGANDGALNAAEDGFSYIAVFNSLGSRNTPGCFGTRAVSGGSNTVDDDSIVGPADGDAVNTDPLIDPNLADNGGLTKTHALVLGSPCIDTALATHYAAGEDQRGRHRPTEGDGAGVAVNDRGAFEYTEAGRPVGDLDFSWCTDLADFLILIDGWQQPFNGDRILSIADFLILIDHWQTGRDCQ